MRLVLQIQYRASCILQNVNAHPIRMLYPNKIIVSNKLLGLSRVGLGLGFGLGFILYA